MASFRLHDVIQEDSNFGDSYCQHCRNCFVENRHAFISVLTQSAFKLYFWHYFLNRGVHILHILARSSILLVPFLFTFATTRISSWHEYRLWLKKCRDMLSVPLGLYLSIHHYVLCPHLSRFIYLGVALPPDSAWHAPVLFGTGREIKYLWRWLPRPFMAQ